MVTVMTRSSIWLAALLLAVVACALAVDRGFAIHMAVFALAALIGLAVSLNTTDFGAIVRGAVKMPDQGRYDDDPIRWGVIATVFWGLAGFLAGLYIALELTWPALNLGFEFTNFGRLRQLIDRRRAIRIRCASIDSFRSSSLRSEALRSTYCQNHRSS